MGAPGAPVGLTATYTGTARVVSVIWGAPGGSIDHYEVWRQGPTPLGSFVLIAPSVTVTSYTDSTFSASTAYVYKAVAVGVTGLRSPDSPHDLAYTALFADDPLVANSTLIKAQHILELRQAVASVRQTAGLGAPAWTDPFLGVGTSIRAVHVGDLRSNLDPALVPLGPWTFTPPPYTDNPLTGGVTIVKAIQIQELRNRVK